MVMTEIEPARQVGLEMKLLSMRTFRKMMRRTPIKSEQAQANCDKIEKLLKNRTTGHIATIAGNPNLLVYTALVLKLKRRYAEVEPIFIGQYSSLYYVNKDKEKIRG